ncbi:alpha/beta hydrolase [Microbacterium sp. CIAB417]|uniref:alpha/beta hydrolase n=1 Tax=Microbacterium sp. CIAB417 TaxID=2860287 RepID=UPI001FAC2A18|nr:alpha/beta hydrolase [Microbacterium sp. CIAB417]
MTLISPNRGYALERLDGDTGSMSWWSGEFARVQDRLETLREAAVQTHGLPGVGQAVSAVRADATKLVAALDVDMDEADLLARVLQSYADAHDQYAQPANAMIDDIEAAHAEWLRCAADADDAQSSADDAAQAGDGGLTALTEQAAEEAAAARDDAAQALAALWTEYERLHGGWDSAYDDAVMALAGGASLTPQELRVLERLLSADGSAEVLELWNAHPDVHDELIEAHPDLIGNLDGIPYAVRAEVNMQRLEDLLGTEPPGRRRDELEAIQRALMQGQGSQRPALLSFDPDGSEQVTAAIAHGDLTTASEINTLVPGMNATVEDMQAWGESARALNRSTGPGSATVVWFGYDTPNLAEEPFMDRAENGAAALGAYLGGLRTLSPDADVNVIAHSYGSTTAAQAIGSRADGFGVTAFIAVGSAGFPDDDTVIDNLTRPGEPRVYATISEDDAVARVGRGTAFGHSTSPETIDHVTVFDSDGGVDSAGEPLAASTGHGALGPGAYLEPGSESFHNVSEIIRSGEPGTERGGEGSTRGFWDAGNWWISDEYALIDF